MNAQTKEFERFIHDHLESEDVGWPHVCHKTGGSSAAWKMLVRGNLVLDLPVTLNARLADFVEALNKGHEKFRCEWETAGQPVVGGFVGQVAPLAANLGFNVHLNCAIAVPTPKAARRFLESGRYDTSHTVAYPGPTPASVEIQFIDGHVLLPRRGIDGAADVPVPYGIAAEYDAVLVNPGARQGRQALLERVAAEFRSDSRCTLGIVGRGDWTSADLISLNETKAWVFFNRTEAMDVATRARGNGPVGNVEEAATVLKSFLGTATRLMISLDKQGACLVNGKKQPQQFPTTPVENGHATGAGDTLTLYATAASALGKSDEEAAEMGVQAASKRVAGEPLPSIHGG